MCWTLLTTSHVKLRSLQPHSLLERLSGLFGPREASDKGGLGEGKGIEIMDIIVEQARSRNDGLGNIEFIGYVNV
jgi:hypothetical protein